MLSARYRNGCAVHHSIFGTFPNSILSQIGKCSRAKQELMKAVRIRQFGGPEVLTYEDVADPRPRKDQVLVRVRACAMNHLDIWVRKGLPGVNLPHILGSDIAGEIVEVGEYVTGLKPGQRVLIAPMHFCNRCPKCVAGRRWQLRTDCGSGSQRRSHPRFARF